MTWQRSGDLARRLYAKGVTSIAIGDLSEEWYLYAIAHPVYGPRDVFPNVLRYYPLQITEHLVGRYRTLADSASAEEGKTLMGEILSDGQVHIPVRLFVRDFYKAGFPIMRYEIRWAPEQARVKGEGLMRACLVLTMDIYIYISGLVTHATDRVLWSLRLPILTDPQKRVAVDWLDVIDKEIKTLEREGKPTRPLNQALTLREDKTIAWQDDKRWDQIMDMLTVLPGEGVRRLPFSHLHVLMTQHHARLDLGRHKLDECQEHRCNVVNMKAVLSSGICATARIQKLEQTEPNEILSQKTSFSRA